MLVLLYLTGALIGGVLGLLLGDWLIERFSPSSPPWGTEYDVGKDLARMNASIERGRNGLSAGA